MTPELLAITEIQGGPFTVAQARLAGLTRGKQRQLEQDGHLTVLRRGVLVETERLRMADTLELHRIETAGALLLRWPPINPERTTWPQVICCAGHRTAAMFWQLRAPLPPENPELLPVDWPAPAPSRRIVELVSPERARRGFKWGVHTRPATLEQADVTALVGLLVTTLERTAVDLARELRRRDALIVADSALRLGASKQRMREIVVRYRGWRGTRQADELVAFADGRAESAAESHARLVLKDHGMAIPDLQVDLSDSRGPIARVDMLYPAHRTIIEVDGHSKYTDPWHDPGEVLLREKLREDRLRDAGWEVVRVTWRQLDKEPEIFVDRVRRAFARARHPVG